MAPLTLLVDAPSLIYRSHFALPDSIRSRDGQVVSAVYGFVSMLARLVADLRPTAAAACLDADWRPQWRVDLVPSYKLHRVAAENEAVDDSIDRQTQIVVRLLKLVRVAAIGAPGCEAEDIIGTLVPGIRGDVAIVSGDRDLFQLVRDPHVWVLYPRRGVSDLVRVDEAEIRRRYDIPGSRYADFAVLRGDPSDGLPGVPGIGEKTASMLIAKYGSLEEVLSASAGARSGPLAKVAANTDYIERAVEVVRIKSDCRVGKPDLKLGGTPGPTLMKVARELGVSGPVKGLVDAIARG